MLARVLEPTSQAQLTDLGGYVVDGLRIAVWAFLQYDNIEDGYSAIIQVNGYTDTNAAIYGQLAGAYYGYKAIPARWRNNLYLSEEIRLLASKLAEMKSCPMLQTRFEEDES